MKKWVIAIQLEREKEAREKKEKRSKGTIDIAWHSNAYENCFGETMYCLAVKRLFLDRKLDEILFCEADLSISEVGQIMGGN